MAAKAAGGTRPTFDGQTAGNGSAIGDISIESMPAARSAAMAPLWGAMREMLRVVFR